MSATTAGAIPSEPRFQRLRARCRAIGRKIKAVTKRGGRKTARATRTSGRFVWTWIKTGAILAFIGVVRLLALVGWVVAKVVWLVFALVGTIIALLALLIVMIALALLWPLGFMADKVDIPLVSHLQYLLKYPRDHSYRVYIKEREAKQGNRAYKIWRRVRHTWFPGYDSAWDSYTDSITGDYQTGAAAEATLDALSEKAAESRQADLNDPDGQFPGAIAEVLESGKIEVAIPLLEQLTALPGPLVNADLSPYVYEPEFYDVLEILMDRSTTIEERAYWCGRREMLRAQQKDRDAVNKHGQVWALIFQRYRHNQSDYPVDDLRTGVKDMARDLEAAVKVAFTPGSKSRHGQ